MSLFHRHIWEETGSDYTPPGQINIPESAGNNLTVHGRDATMALLDLEREELNLRHLSATGETHIYLKCRTCNLPNSVSVPGKREAPKTPASPVSFATTDEDCPHVLGVANMHFKFCPRCGISLAAWNKDKPFFDESKLK